MTVYEDYEKSQAGGAPIEAYRFIGTHREYLYTSHDNSVTVAGRTFEPIVIQRNTLKAGTHSEDNVDLEITMSVEVALVKDYILTIAPPDLTLIIYRVHRGSDYGSDYVIAWNGPVSSFRIDGRVAKLKVPSVFSSLLNGTIPTVCYQSQCNHVLYDGMCGVSRSVNTVTTTVVSASVSSELIVLTSNGGKADGFFVGGEIVSSAGERRMITSHIGNQLHVNYPFSKLNIGDVVSVSGGCNHSTSDCSTKFSNLTRFGGFPYVPNINPFESGI